MAVQGRDDRGLASVVAVEVVRNIWTSDVFRRQSQQEILPGWTQGVREGEEAGMTPRLAA